MDSPQTNPLDLSLEGAHVGLPWPRSSLTRVEYRIGAVVWQFCGWIGESPPESGYFLMQRLMRACGISGRNRPIPRNRFRDKVSLLECLSYCAAALENCLDRCVGRYTMFHWMRFATLLVVSLPVRCPYVADFIALFSAQTFWSRVSVFIFSIVMYISLAVLWSDVVWSQRLLL